MTQRRANWVGLRTLRQRPKAIGHTDDGEPIYEIRSVRLVLHGTSSHFVRLTRCSRCMRDLAGAPVLSAADLERPSRPVICADCVRTAGVSTLWEYEHAVAAAEPLSPAALAPAGGEAEPQPATAEAPPPARRNVLEGHLRAVTERVNELGRIARIQQTDAKERAERQEATAAALREELAAVRASTDDNRAELQRLAAAHADLEQWRAHSPPAEDAGAGQLGEEVARLGRLLEEQRADLAAAIASLVATQQAHGQLAHACQLLEGRVAEAVAQTADRAEVDLSTVEDLVARRSAEAEGRLAEALARPADQVDLPTVEKLVTSRLAEAERRLAPAPDLLDVSAVDELVATRLDEAEGRLAHQLAGQWGDLETTIEKSVAAAVAGFVGADERLAGGQRMLEERVEELAGRVARAFGRLDSLLDRLDSVEVALRGAPGEGTVAIPAAGPPPKVPGDNLFESLDRQLEAAARRLAARSQDGAGRGEA